MDDDSNSIIDSGGTGHGLSAFHPSLSVSVLNALASAMTEVGEWIKGSAGCFLGHVKSAVTAGEKTMTLNLTDLGTGVERHGALTEGVHADIRFMAAVVDVDKGELADKMRSAMISRGFRLKDRNIIELR